MFTRALVRRFPVLANRNFRLLLADRLLAPMAATFSLVGVSFAVLDVTRSTADLSYVLAAQLGPSLIFLLVGGVIADRAAPHLVIIGANVMIAVGEGTFGILVLSGRPNLWVMVGLEMLTGSGMAIFYPASMALLPTLVPAEQMQEASAISRLGMNGAQMAGAALAGACVAVFGPGWALAVCGIGMLGTIPLLLAIRVQPRERERAHAPSVIRELREGWSEFRSHTWLWATVLQFTVVLAAWCGGFQVLGPAVAKAHLGGPAAWGLITSAEAVGLIVGGLVSLRWTPARPVRFVALIGGAIAISPLSLAMLLPLPVICLAAFGLGIAIEMMSVIWTVTMAAKIRPDMLARVSGYDGLGSMMGMPVGAVVAGPIAAAIGVSATQYGAAAITVIASALALIPRDVRTMRSGQAYPVPHEPIGARELAAPVASAGTETLPRELASSASPVGAAQSAA
ncbi:MAG TPA: MFS transporter [Streptosporangiaceae bacterium]|nr:MFS transporter [Streptosporangiaceae bacterium]